MHLDRRHLACMHLDRRYLACTHLARRYLACTHLARRYPACTLELPCLQWHAGRMPAFRPLVSNESKQSSNSLNSTKGWHSRGYLPHFDSPDLYQAVTFRLDDSLPTDVVAALIEDPEVMSNLARRVQVEAYMDAGYGECYLQDPRIGALVENTLLYFDGTRYQMMAWVVMPNHVHTLIRTVAGYSLSGILHSWKSYTAKAANRVLGREGRFWSPEYFDRYVRDKRHFARVVAYINNNPVKAGLVESPEDWPFSSARLWSSGTMSV